VYVLYASDLLVIVVAVGVNIVIVAFSQ